MSAKNLQQTTYSRRLTSSFSFLYRFCHTQVLCEFTVTKSVDAMLTPHNGGKQFYIGRTDRVQGALPFSIELSRRTQLIDHLESGFGIINNRQGVQIFPVGRLGHLGISIQIGYAFCHREPSQYCLSIAFSMTTDFKLVWTVDNSLNSQYGSELVVHFYPVTFHPVFNPSTRQTLFIIILDLALEVAVQFAPKESQYILGAEADSRMPLQFFVSAG